MAMREQPETIEWDSSNLRSKNAMSSGSLIPVASPARTYIERELLNMVWWFYLKAGVVLCATLVKF